jgi:hypothetical protein
MRVKIGEFQLDKKGYATELTEQSVFISFDDTSTLVRVLPEIDRMKKKQPYSIGLHILITGGQLLEDIHIS